MRASIPALLAAAASLAAPAPAEAACNRVIANRTPHVVVVSQDGGPAITVGPRRSARLRYAAPGRIDVSVFCRAPHGAARAAPDFQASYDTVAVLDRCFLDIDGGGTQPLALNAPRQGDIVVAPYGLACGGLSN